MFVITSDGAGAWLRWRQAEGQRLGDIKAPSLHTREGLSAVFQGVYRDVPCP